MSKAQVHDLVEAINSLLSRPIGSAARVLSGQLISQREQLKHLRSRLENTDDFDQVEGLQQECKTLIGQIQSQQKQLQFDPPNTRQSVTGQLANHEPSDQRLADRLEVQLPSLTQTSKGSDQEPDNVPDIFPDNFPDIFPDSVTQILSSAKSADSTKEISDMANRISDAATMLGAEQIAAIVRQTLSQTLAVERALIVGEVSASLRSLIDSQKRSQVTNELQELEQQRQNLRQEITRLEQERQTLLEQFKSEAARQRQEAELNLTNNEAIASSIQSLDRYMRDQVKHEIREEVAQEISQALANQFDASQVPTITSAVANALEQELIEKIKNQTDRFLLALDAMFTSTFQALESNIQGYQASVSQQFEQMQSTEQMGAALLGNLVERINTQLESIPVSSVQIEPETVEDQAEVAENFIDFGLDEPPDEELIESLIAGTYSVPSSFVSPPDVSQPDVPPELGSQNLDFFPEENQDDATEILLRSANGESPSIINDVESPLLSAFTESEDTPEISGEPHNSHESQKESENQEEDFSNFLKELESSPIADGETESPVDKFKFNLDDFGSDIDPDFDPNAETQIADYKLPSDIPTSAVLDEDLELLEWLDRKSDLQQSQEAITDGMHSAAINSVDEDPDLLAWLESNAESPSTNESLPSEGNFSNFGEDNETLSNWSGSDNLPSEKITVDESDPEISEDFIDLVGIDDDALNSDESLILLPDVGNTNKDKSWTDESIIKDLSADLENLDAGLGISPLIASNLDLVIRNTPFAQVEVKTRKTEQQVQLKADLPDLTVSADLGASTFPHEIIPEIIEDPEALFPDANLETQAEDLTLLQARDFTDIPDDLFIDSFLENVADEPSAIELSPPVEDDTDLFNNFMEQGQHELESSLAEIPDIIEDPEALFSSSDDAVTTDAIANNFDNSLENTLESLLAEASNIPDLEEPALESPDQSVSPHTDLESFLSQSSNSTDETEFLFADNYGSDVIDNSGDHDLESFLSQTSNSTDETEFLFSDAFSDSVDIDLENEFDNTFTDFDLTSEIDRDPNPISSPTQSSNSDDAVLFISEESRETYLSQVHDDLAETATNLGVPEPTLDQEFADLMQGLDLDLDSDGHLDLDDHPSLPDIGLVEEFETVLQGFAGSDDDLTAILLGDLESPLFMSSSRGQDDRQTDAQEDDILADDFFAALENDKLTEFADLVSQEDALPAEMIDDDDLEIDDLSDVEDKLTEFADSELQTASWNEFIASTSADPALTMPDLNWDNDILDLPGLEAGATHTEFLDVDSIEVQQTSQTLSLQAIPPSLPKVPDYKIDHTWFLGVDFGSSYVRASILNANTGRIYPLSFGSETSLTSSAVFSSEQSNTDPMQVAIALAPLENAIAPPPQSENGNGSGMGEPTTYVSQFKHLLKMGLPYSGISSWQPILQWHGSQKIALRWLVAALRQLLMEVKNVASHAELPDAQEILSRLDGVILGYPSQWSDTYVLNLREAALNAGLVSQPEQVMVVEQAIAPLLTLIHKNKSPQQIALIIDSGAISTSLLLVRPNATGIQRSDINYRSIDYAGTGLNQDIVTQLLYPHWRMITNPERDACNLEHLELPAPGNPDPANRSLLQQYLLTSSVGTKLLQFAEQLKLELSNHPDLDQWVDEVSGQPLMVLRRELESQVLLPFRQNLNHKLNDLLSNSGIFAEDIAEVWQIGGTMRLPFITNWLSQKLPNATKTERLSDSAVADGLAIAPLYRYLLNIARQQYSDYFLIHEMCRLNLRNAVNFNSLMQQLQNQGINTRACRDRIGNILQGDLPAGLFPWQEPEQGIVLSDPGLNSELFTGRLFEPETDGTYLPNTIKFQLLRAYLQAITASMRQSISEPLLFPDFAIGK
jgi:hypothetical protein